MSGKAYLVGAGPGDPRLLTARGQELLAAADVVLYDRLVAPESLDWLRGTELVYVGKEPGRPSMPQEEINARLVELGQAGKQVVRLKGGDPFVFGRGGEEAEALAAAGIPFEVVPGVTAGIAAPAYAGIPVTQRGEASAVAFVTGHEDPDKPESAIDWAALAAFPGTLVFYMGVRNVERIATALRDAGRGADEPVGVVASGTLPHQRVVTGTLGDIAERVAEEGIEPPAITVVGPVVRHHERLAWFDANRPPLFGRTVVVTRAREDASFFGGHLRGLGARVIEAPTIRREELEGEAIDGTIARIEEYALVCVTSGSAAELLHEALDRCGRDARALAGATVAAIGGGTASMLRSSGLRADVLPERQTAEGLVDALAQVPVEGRRALIVRPETAREVLPEALRQRGAEVDVLALYRTVPEPLPEHTIEDIGRADYVTFASGSSVRFFLDAIGERFPRDARVVSIGPATSEAARERGLEVHVEAERHDVDGLVEALLADAERSA